MRSKVIASISIVFFWVGLLIFSFWALPSLPKERTAVEEMGLILVITLSEVGIIFLCVGCIRWVIKR